MTQYLYIIECQGYYKIGVANDVVERMKHLQTGNPFLLNLYCAYEFDKSFEAERALHSNFWKQNTVNEWFLLDNRDLSTAREICVQMGGRETRFVKEKKPIPSLYLVIESVTNWILNLFIKHSWVVVGKSETADYYEIRLPARIWKHEDGVFRLVGSVGNSEEQP